jgi:phospholipase/carboxylesterase
MNLKESPEAVVLEPQDPAVASVIWLHGVGADGHDFVPLVPDLGLPPLPAVRFVFPHAPVRPITMHGGTRMRAWCDFRNLNRSDQQDENGIRDSERRIRGLIRQEINTGVAANRIVVAGFSQGGALALQVALRYPERLAGLLALSAYMPLHTTVAQERSAANADLPILMCHGAFDTVLPIPLGAMARDYLRALGYPVEWHDYPVQHELCAEEIEAIGRWLQERLR